MVKAGQLEFILKSFREFLEDNYMFGHSTETVRPQLDPTQYLKDMTRKERYEWENYEIQSLERLKTMIEVVRRGLNVDKRDKPGVENDLIALELVSDEAQGIINRS